MIDKRKILSILFLLNCASIQLVAQGCNTMNIQFQSDIPSACNEMTMTMIHDVLGRPYLYVANKEAGLKIYDISVITSPVWVSTVPVLQFDSLDVMNLSQDGNYLFLAVGNTFTNPQAGGMVVVDVANPGNPLVTDYFVVPGSSSGAGAVKAEGDYAYLAAMRSGLVILNVADKNSIQLVSRFVPDIHFPPIASPDTTKINARGLEVKNSIVYLCYDAGGFRIINCTDKNNPVETGRFCNPLLYLPFNLPRAYNNLVIDDSLVYIAVDYCGMEVLNIADTSHILLNGWWNPYNCPNNNWFTSPVHANEIFLDKSCDLVMLSTGKSDLHVLDVSNPAQPDSCNYFGGVNNSIGTWGAGWFQNQIYLSYICVPFPNIPFPSNWTGVKILTYTSCLSGFSEIKANEILTGYPVPAVDEVILKAKDFYRLKSKVIITNTIGQSMPVRYKYSDPEKIILDISTWDDGIYFMTLIEAEHIYSKKIMKSSLVR